MFAHIFVTIDRNFQTLTYPGNQLLKKHFKPPTLNKLDLYGSHYSIFIIFVHCTEVEVAIPTTLSIFADYLFRGNLITF